MNIETDDWYWSTIATLCPITIHVNALDFNKCRSKVNDVDFDV